MEAIQVVLDHLLALVAPDGVRCWGKEDLEPDSPQQWVVVVTACWALHAIVTACWALHAIQPLVDMPRFVRRRLLRQAPRQHMAAGEAPPGLCIDLDEAGVLRVPLVLELVHPGPDAHPCT